ncbi:hypothetical protein EYZ11_004767 [Aspergillus tanneri]|uniref:Uncharacterized protein n=1 Tax=Aspergillus tanneri TaxID=1220188 RepID=A0A4S3JKA1_9EURO|nr:hypothetical protein EYZ11_004767 [Aspergillus tanneri]
MVAHANPVPETRAASIVHALTLYGPYNPGAQQFEKRYKRLSCAQEREGNPDSTFNFGNSAPFLPSMHSGYARSNLQVHPLENSNPLQPSGGRSIFPFCLPSGREKKRALVSRETTH